GFLFETPSKRAAFSGSCSFKSKHSVFREGPYPEASGDWKFNLKGLAAGKVIELTVALKNHHDSPMSVLVTVWID
ncbi:MAG: hypothetical protein ACTH3B_09030, partial [Pseudoalteromonas sp.]